MTGREQQQIAWEAERQSLIADATALAAYLRSLDLTGHERHGLRPWRTCRFCWRMSLSVFIEWPLRRRLAKLGYWLRPPVMDPLTEPITFHRRWRWGRTHARYEAIIDYASQARPHGPRESRVLNAFGFLWAAARNGDWKP